MIGGDLNARIGEEGSIIWEKSSRRDQRKSKDKTMNREGKKMMEFIEEEGWSILNGNYEGDETGEWTYIGPGGNSVIDYGIANVEAREEIENFVVEERTESDHLPLRINIRYTGIDIHIQRKIKKTREKKEKYGQKREKEFSRIGRKIYLLTRRGQRKW